MSVYFKVLYNSREQDLKLLKSYDYHSTSKLSWQKNSEFNTYDFVLQDDVIFDEGKTAEIKLDTNLISFWVSERGEFVILFKYLLKYSKQIRLV